VFFNVSGATLLRAPYRRCKRKVFIDTDPGWNHFCIFPRLEKTGRMEQGYRSHDFFFTYAERFGQPDCPLPSFGLPWLTTRPPVLLDLWQRQPPGEKWTSVMSWSPFAKECSFQGVEYGAKEREFPHIECLPAICPGALEMAVLGKEAPTEHWRNLGWSTVDGMSVSHTPEAYRGYIQGSRGELSVAKNVYVATHSGWFSCRSVCYLAAGLPVVLQNTGFSETVPTGCGLLAFSDERQAAAAIAAVEKDYADHQAAARELARSHFEASRVLGELLNAINLN
jgi:hypothetical protein